MSNLQCECSVNGTPEHPVGMKDLGGNLQHPASEKTDKKKLLNYALGNQRKPTLVITSLIL